MKVKFLRDLGIYGNQTNLIEASGHRGENPKSGARIRQDIT